MDEVTAGARGRARGEARGVLGGAATGGRAMSASRITYYAFAQRPDGKIGQLLVTREIGRQVSQEWTSVTYYSAKEAYADMERLNCGGKPS